MSDDPLPEQTGSSPEPERASRERAVRMVQEGAARRSEALEALSAEERRRKLDELQARHIELESQNKGLRRNGLLTERSRDITERERTEEALRKSEERFRVAQEMSLDAFTILDAVRDEAGRIVDFSWAYANPMAGRILRHLPAELVGRRLLEVLPGNKLNSDLFDRYVRVVETGEPHDYEFRYEGEGIRGWFRNMSVKLGDGVAVHFSDITDRKGAEADRLALERRLLVAQKLESLGTMAGGIAHDFNNLLMGILGNLEMAQSSLAPTSPARECIEEAMRAGWRAADLTRQILAYSGRALLSFAPMDLNELVRQNEPVLRAAVPETVRMDFRLSPDPALIEADANLVQQVMMNLISNATEAIGGKAGVITLATSAQACDEGYLSQSRLNEKPSPGRFVCMRVSDTGCGMDKQAQERLFDPFFTTKFIGRGLGMSVLHGIMQSHKGAILVESQTGHGTTIELLFPACEAEGGGRKGTSTRRSDKAAPSRKVLVVEDEETVRRLCVKSVQRLGYEVISAADGEEAVALFKEHVNEIACVLLDLTMPRKGGLSTFRELRAVRSEIPVILCSGYSEHDATRQFGNEGLAGFMQKPYALEELKFRLARAFEGSSQAVTDDAHP